MSYYIEEKEWNKLNGVGDGCAGDHKLVVLDGLIYNVGSKYIIHF